MSVRDSAILEPKVALRSSASHSLHSLGMSGVLTVELMVEIGRGGVEVKENGLAKCQESKVNKFAGISFCP